MNSHDYSKRFYLEASGPDSRGAIGVHDNTGPMEQSEASAQREPHISFTNVVGTQKETEKNIREQETCICPCRKL
jgi:hypothetical protein